MPCTKGKDGRGPFDPPAEGAAHVELQVAGSSQFREATWKRGLAWDLVLALAAAVYLDLVLFQGFEIPVLGFVWIAVAGTRIVDLHRTP